MFFGAWCYPPSPHRFLTSLAGLKLAEDSHTALPYILYLQNRVASSAVLHSNTPMPALTRSGGLGPPRGGLVLRGPPPERQQCKGSRCRGDSKKICITCFSHRRRQPHATKMLSIIPACRQHAEHFGLGLRTFHVQWLGHSFSSQRPLGHILPSDLHKYSAEVVEILGYAFISSG